MHPFEYLRPRGLAEAIAAFRASHDARWLAGGQTLIPTLKLRLASPALLIDLREVPDLGGIRVEADRVVIGAMTIHAEVAASPELRAALPALATLAGGIGDRQVRNMGTLGGSIAACDPAADYPAALLALGAEIRTDRRALSADDFFLGMFETALEPDEVVTSVAVPLPRAAAYARIDNPASRYALAGVFVARFDDAVRVAVTGAAPAVFRADAIERALSADFSPAALDGIAIDPDGLNEDMHASAEYRAHLIGVLARRAVVAAS
ncbi:MAG: xanthine dehydrogenase family protein subunit M [Alphaproteobacteria bacterium]|nr:xanthine dehydrogenase family protein subunit M [Alphaproteobacteria bacterium]